MSPAVRIIAVLACLCIVLWGMSQYANYIVSVALAILIALAADPLVVWLRRRGVPRLAVLLIALFAVYGVLALLAVVLVYAGAQFLAEVPEYTQQAQEAAAGLQAQLAGMGLGEAGADAVAGGASLAKPLEWIASLVQALGDVLGNLTTLVLILTFLFVDVILWPGRLEESGRRGHGYARRLTEFALDLRQFIVVMVIVGATIGALNTLLFTVFGVPSAGLWGVLSGILNFIPFIGFVLALIPPAILTLLEYGLERTLVLVVLFVAINGFVQNVVQPRLVVARLSLTPWMSLLSATFWPLVLGPVGAIIGVPLTMAVRSLWLEADPATRWLAELTGTKLPDIAPRPEIDAPEGG